MADHTIPGIIGIVVIVLIAAVFLQTSAATTNTPVSVAQPDNLAGEATTNPSTSSADRCEPTRYCSGTKLIIVREDCSRAEAFCKYGCLDEPQPMCA